MKAVIQTQIRENYGAHDWDGQGECPQRWKYKGGNTYVVEMTIRQAQDNEYWKYVMSFIESKDDGFEEYSIGETLVDDDDFVKSDHVADWDDVIYCEINHAENLMKCSKAQRSYDMSNRVVGERVWTQQQGGVIVESKLTMLEEVA